MALSRVSLSDLEIDDEPSFRHVGLYADLKDVVAAMGPTFLAPGPGEWLGWDRALLLNLLYWEPGTSDVLTSRAIAADVVMHVAWHELAKRHLAPGVLSDLLGESIASAFDLYLVGRLLGHSPESSFLASQVPQMSEAAAESGLDEGELEELLQRVAENPERSFEQLRELLFDASRALLEVDSPAAGLEVLERFDDHPFASILHHYELTTWVLRARIDRANGSKEAGVTSHAGDDTPMDPLEMDRRLRSEKDAIALLERSWVRR